MPILTRHILNNLLLFWPAILAVLLSVVTWRLARLRRLSQFLSVPYIASALIVLLTHGLVFLLGGTGGAYLLLIGWAIIGAASTLLFVSVFLIMARTDMPSSTARPKRSPNPYVAGGLIVPCVLLGSYWSTLLAINRCDQRHRRDAERLVASIREYTADHPGFPESLSTLEPDYLSSVPAPTCFEVGAAVRAILAVRETNLGYVLSQCPGKGYVLAVEDMIGSGYQRYSFETGHWSNSSANFLDVPDRLCSGLE